ncbi:MAG: hypothetical protein SGILL_002751 [Bacillariaceae sp.]
MTELLQRLHNDWHVIIFEYFCPGMGVIISTCLYMAPVRDLQKCLQRGSLGVLNPTPWAVMSGNCFGWLAYAYYARDPFILASNVPGILVSTWLNAGASKLQYYEAKMQQQQVNEEESSTSSEEGGDEERSSSQSDGDSNKRTFGWTRQDKTWITILAIWIFLLICVGWLGLIPDRTRQKDVVGLLANINVLFFYGSPLQTMTTVIRTKCSDSIHKPTVALNCFNAGFWALYGVAINNIVVYGPNGVGLILGTMQVLLCCCYGKSHDRLVPDVDTRPLLDEDNDDGDDHARNEIEQQEPVTHVV